MKPLTRCAALWVLGLMPWAETLAHTEASARFTDSFPLEDCSFNPGSRNPYFPLVVGRQLYYNNQRCLTAGRCDELEELWITVQPQTRNIVLRIGGELQTVETHVVEERETADGELVEVSRNFFASCRPTHDIYYFGEEVDIYEDGAIVSHDGAWLAGTRRARPGIIMPGPAFLLGSRYYQELASDVALDRAEHIAMDLQVRLPLGNFQDCVKIRETSPLEPGSQSTKVYCPNVGMVRDDELELVSITEP